MGRNIDDLVDHLDEPGPLRVGEMAEVAPRAVAPPVGPRIKVPARHNPRLAQAVERVNQDQELWTLWRCANVNAVDRLHMSDHGWVHVQIVANVALKMLRLLRDARVQPSLVKDHGLEYEDAEVVVVLGALLHDLGMVVQRPDHERFSVVLAWPKLRDLLGGLYAVEPATIIAGEALHAILAHHGSTACLTIEAGVVKVGDALDMTKGRSRIPFEAGKVDIHSVSAMAIEEVAVRAGETKPIRVEVRMTEAAGVFQLDELLKRKLLESSIADQVEVLATIESPAEHRILEYYRI